MKRFSQAVALAIALLGAASCADNKPDASQQEQMPLQVPVVTLGLQPATLNREYVTAMEAVRHVELRARARGFLERIFVDEGSHVRKGQLLFQINAAEYRAEADRAEASRKIAVAGVKTAEVEVARVRTLVDKNIISASELDLARARLDAARGEVEQARAAQEKARLHLGQAQVRAPFAGVINRMPLKIGSLVEEGTLLTSLSDISEVYAYFEVSERDYLSFFRKNPNGHQGSSRQVEMLLADESVYPLTGQIETMATVFEEGSGTIAFRARFKNPQDLLRHGSTGKVRLSQQVDRALLVPQKAVFEIQDKNYVYVVEAGNRVRSQSFTAGPRLRHYYVVTAGLKPGDRVVYEGLQNLRSGAAVRPVPVRIDSLGQLAGRRPQS